MYLNFFYGIAVMLCLLFGMGLTVSDAEQAAREINWHILPGWFFCALLLISHMVMHTRMKRADCGMARKTQNKSTGAKDGATTIKPPK